MDHVNQLWNSPPQPSLSGNTRNRAARFFGHRLFLWMPVNIWGVQLHCPHTDDDNRKCSGVLTRAGIHQKTRLVVDVDCFYNMASEYLRCSKCGKKMVAWAHNIVEQLDRDRQLLFPAILTAKLSCDKKVVTLLRQRGLGNSSSMVQKQLEELHGDNYLRKVHNYLSACKTFQAATSSGLLSAMSVEQPPPQTAVPQHRWLMKVYQLDVLQRIDIVKASITSLFGTVLKLDSTKKITKKLAGKSAKTAMWATNVGNEHGQVIMSVLTANEGQGLADMIDGLCRRYHEASVPPPRLLYVDRDCCDSSCVQKYFRSWPFLLVRLDIWHFMRRLAIGCTTDAHPLYGVFMGHLSQCIFKWEEEDVNLLKKAKRAEMIQNHIPNPSDADVVQQIKSAELALHCRRVTRGTRETTSLISQLILSMDGDKGLDILGVPLFDSLRMQGIWAKQSPHVACLQDPDGVQLYTQVGTVRKGGVVLPKYRCARGSTSLESFHLHMNRFIPGTLASDVDFQVYLLDGVHRWNQDRSRVATTEREGQGPLSYDVSLRHSVNRLSQDVLGKDLCTVTVPGKYTGELIGLDYLYSQSTGAPVRYQETAASIEEDVGLDEDYAEEDEGFEEASFEDITIPALQPSTAPQPQVPERKPILQVPSTEEYQQLVEDLHQTQHQQLVPVTCEQATPTAVAKAELHVATEPTRPVRVSSPSDSGPTLAAVNLPDDVSIKWQWFV
ncbi:uncharacterized protein [Argopecten irradians]|uniref:uncharacterized protein n=1 Tax=Argopecten irradians TaxID=31199 RepID=UPI003710988D